jgi:hypothetical protein
MFQALDPPARKQLIEQASRCRRLAANLGPTDVAQRLLELADEYEAQFMPSPAPGASNQKEKRL